MISASRRTDIPAFYGDWFQHRLELGWCEVPNPFNPSQVRTVSLERDAVSAFIFWTRDPRPFLPVVEILERRGYPSVFLFTITGYGPPLEPLAPPVKDAVTAFIALAAMVGPERVVWRYDPIVLGPGLGVADHRRRFTALSRRLAGHCRTVKISILDLYRKTRRRLAAVDGGRGYLSDPLHEPALGELLASLVGAATDAGMVIETCAEEGLVGRWGLHRGRCVDPELLRRVFGLSVPEGRDRGQRPDCACGPSCDIGRSDSCLHGCAYCYATTSHRVALANRRRHDPEAPALY